MIKIEFTNEVLKEIDNKKELNKVYSKYFYRLSLELQEILLKKSETYKKKSDRINDCLNLWQWDVYHQNKLMDLQRVNRCMDNRFCPNCRKLNLASAIHNFSPHFKKLLDDGYFPYLLTLTIPNVKSDCLNLTIDKLNKSFRKFLDLFNQDIGNGKKGFKGRLIKFDACLKVIEITCNNINGTYHPHFHCIVFSKDYNEFLFEKRHQGPFQRKTNSYIKFSDMDIHIMKIWKMCFDGLRTSLKNYNFMSDNWFDLYLCDIKEMNVNGIYEVMKYTFKDTDINSYNNFKTIFLALEGKRIRQGYGLLYNLKLEEEEGEKQSLEEFLQKEESPEKILSKAINELITVYSNYKKISRFKAYNDEVLKLLD